MGGGGLGLVGAGLSGASASTLCAGAGGAGASTLCSGAGDMGAGMGGSEACSLQDLRDLNTSVGEGGSVRQRGSGAGCLVLNKREHVG